MLKFFSILFLILFFNGCGNGEISYGQTDAIMPMSNDGSYQLALDTSLTKFRLGFPCKYLAVSSNSTGQALAYVDSNWNMPILLYPGYSGLVNAKESLYVDVGPQPGKILQLFFGDQPLISSPAAKFSNDPSILVSVYRNLITNTTGNIQIVAPTDNIKGIKILDGVVSCNALASTGWQGYVISSLILDTGEPLAQCILSRDTASPATWLDGKLDHIEPFIIPVGRGLIWNHNAAYSGGSVTSTILLNYQLL